MTSSNRRPGPQASGASRQTESSQVTSTPIAQIKPHNGAISLLVSGKPVNPLFLDMPPEASSEQAVEARAKGVSLFRLRGADLGWTGPGHFDYRALDARLADLLGGDSQTCCIVELTVDPPAWWLTANVSECAGFAVKAEGEGADLVVSWASTKWRSEAGDALERLIRHIGRSPWGRRCLGWQIAAGEDGEWRHPQAANLPDNGAKMLVAFRNFVLDKYRRNTGVLKKSWFDTRADFEKMRCPGVRERAQTSLGVLRNPFRSRYILDYYECFYNAQTASILHFCKIAKTASLRNTIVGLSFAKLVGRVPGQEGGYAYPDAVFESEDVDFFANKAGSEDSTYPNIALGSLQLREKLFLHVPLRGTGAEKGAAVALCNQSGLILPVDTDPEAIQRIAAVMNTALTAPPKSRARTSQVAVIVDPAAALYTTAANWLGPLLVGDQLEQLSAVGATFDVFNLSDLFHAKFPERKVTFFLEAFYLSEAERRRSDARYKRSNKTTVWMWPLGVIGEEGIALENGSQLTGQKLRLEATEINLRVRVAEANDPCTWGMHVGSSFGIDRAVSPSITINDKAAIRLGANSDNKTNFSVRRAEQWTSVSTAMLGLPAAVLRNIIKDAECHLFVARAEEGRLIQADARCVAVTSLRGGTVTISLPGPHEVRDSWTGKNIARETSDISVRLDPGQVGLFDIRPIPKPKRETPSPNATAQA